MYVSNVSNVSNIGSAIAKVLRNETVQKTEDGSDRKLKKILSKFRAGHKLTPAELQYLAKNAPDMYQKVVQIQRQREQLEEEIKNAGSKEEAQEIVTDKISMCLKLCESGDTFSQDAITNQFHDALEKCQKDIEGQKGQDKSEQDEPVQGETGLKSDTYASSGDFEEEQKKNHGKNINVVI